MINVFKKCSEENILRWLEDKSSSKEHQSMTCLYSLFYDKVKNWVLKHRGNEIDAQDSLTEALISFVQSYRNGKYIHEGKLEPFFMRIAMYKFYDICRKRKGENLTDETNSIDELFPGGIASEEEWKDPLIEKEESEQEQNRYKLVEKCLNKLSISCKDRLVRFYYLDQSHKEIALALGDSSEAVSKVMKNKCEKKLKEFVFNN